MHPRTRAPRNGLCNGHARAGQRQSDTGEDREKPTKSANADDRPWERLETATCKFLRKVRREFQKEFQCDPKRFRDVALRSVRRALPLRRGRPNDPRIDEALRMLERGRSIKEVLRLQLPNFDDMDAYGRYLAEKGIRTAIARRRRLKATQFRVKGSLKAIRQRIQQEVV